jgi:hypothetical protein
MKQLIALVSASVLFLITNGLIIGGEPIALLELRVGKDRIEGRIAAHDDQKCWLLTRDGRLASFNTDDVTDFHEVEPRFRPLSSLDLRDQLQKEFGRNFEVKTTQHYVVVATRSTADRYATLFEGIYRQFHAYFSTRGFRMTDPEFPLIAVVQPDQQAFVDYCVAEGIRPQPGLVGCYLPGSNRVVLYDRGSSTDVDETIIHEATHQVAFNTGVHSRIGQSPHWLVEGLATLFEAEGVRKLGTKGDIQERLNLERFHWFQEYRQERRPAKSLEAFLREDSLFKKAPLDAYSQAWALSFYLAETRPAEFAKYLKIVATRNPLETYPADARIKDFRDAFGRDLEIIENGMLRFFSRFGE